MALLPRLATAALLLSALAACGGSGTGANGERLTIAATAVPHAEILEVVKPILKQEGVDLDVRVFNDYVQPNDQLVQKQVDANYFQTEPYLDAYNRDRKTDLVKVIGVHIEPFGAYSRRVKSLDELPQLINVLRGDMSLVGPRPHALAHDDKYSKLIASYAQRQHVKPGITGLAQVQGLRGATPAIEDMQLRVAHDLIYIKSWSFVLDLRILLRTVGAVLRHKGV